MKAALLSTLRNSKEYISGQELCERFGVSRTAIWKVMNQLKEEGYEIEAVSNKGYRILSVPDILSKSELESRFEHTEWIGKEVYYFDEIDSTNAKAKQIAEITPHGSIILADHQTIGKGRRGRNWVSPPDSGIWMSLLLKPDIMPDKASMLTLLMALSVSNAIVQVLGIENQIKWPNDIVINNKKVCGVLTEMSAEVDYVHYVVIGVGINVNMTEMHDEIKESATSLKREVGYHINRALLIENILINFEHDYTIFLKTNDLSNFKEVYNQKLINKDRQVKIIQRDTEFTGVAHGIRNNGELIVETETGFVNVSSGEVSVRGVYGYV